VAAQVRDLPRCHHELGDELEHEQRPDTVAQPIQQRREPAGEVHHQQHQPHEAEHRHRRLQRAADPRRQLGALALEHW
jgi:hypothetical protein